MKYHIITYGCQMNWSDSERIAAALEEMNYQQALNINEADLIVVNMCSVRQSAVDRIYGKIVLSKQLKKKQSAPKTLLTGCILRKDFQKFKHHFDYILPIKTLLKWQEYLKNDKYRFLTDQRDCSFNEKFGAGYLKSTPVYSKTFSILVPVSTGCNNFCAFCVVPYTRGPEFSRPAEDIISEIEEAVRKGCKEVWLLGQNVNSYDSKQRTANKEPACRQADNQTDFPGLLKMVNEIPGDFWIRFTSPHPKDLSEEFIETMAKCEKVTKYINLPVQSGDDEILKKMNRPYTVEKYKSLIKKLRNKMPDISISTDVIVGFPGETKEQFQNTTALFKEVGFDMAYISKYSPRPKTAAAELENDVSQKRKDRREKILTEILAKTALKNNEQYIGKTVKVLVDKSKNGFLLGKTEGFKTVRLKGNKKLIGQFITAEITDALPWGLKGEARPGAEGAR